MGQPQLGDGRVWRSLRFTFCRLEFSAAAPRRLPQHKGPMFRGALGYALSAAVGAAIGRPGAPVVAIMGDGSFGFTAGELETVSRLGVPILMLVLSNRSYGWIKAGQRAGYRLAEVPGRGHLVMVTAGTAHGIQPLAGGRSPFHFGRRRPLAARRRHVAGAEVAHHVAPKLGVARRRGVVGEGVEGHAPLGLLTPVAAQAVGREEGGHVGGERGPTGGGGRRGGPDGGERPQARDQAER